MICWAGVNDPQFDPQFAHTTTLGQAPMSHAPTPDNSTGSSHDAHEAHEAHEGPIKTPKQLIVAVIAGFLVPILLAIMLANFVASGTRPNAGTAGSTDAQAVAKRIQPVGTIEIKDASDVASLKSGEQVYTAQCAACHTSGAAGAPKLADAAAWGPRIKTGFEALVQSALKGKGAMGAQGGGDFSDVEISRAVAYLANQGGAKFDEPKPAAAAASAAAK
jgi:cytochrome c5